jgi:hypothetical protein
VLYAKPPFGYAVKFTKMRDETRRQLEHALTLLRSDADGAAIA